MSTERSGPLTSVKVLEVGGIGPNPFAGMLLADMGADVLRVDRPGAAMLPRSSTSPAAATRSPSWT